MESKPLAPTAGERDACIAEVRRFGTLTIDHARFRAELAGAPLPLTRLEFDLLALLATNCGRVVTYRELTDRVLQRYVPSAEATLRVHLSHLRTKLGPARQCVATVRGRGLAFDAEATTASAAK